MNRRQSQLLLCCALVLFAGVTSVAQQSTSPVPPQKPSPALEATRVHTQQKLAAEHEKRQRARIEREKKRTVDAVISRQKREATRAVLEEKRATARAAHEAKRAVTVAARAMAPPDGTFRLLGSRPSLDTGRVVTGAPYSATAVTEHTHTLSDGNRIIKKNETTYYRDGEGRVRLEQKLKTIGKWNADGEPASIITIWDPVTGRYSSLDPRTRTAVTGFRRPAPAKVTTTRSEAHAQNTSTTQPKPAVAAQASNRPSVHTSSDGKRRRESLGQQTMQGVTAEGTRSTLTIPAGEIGNVLPIEVVDETWYSPDLQVKVMTRHSDPRTGETVYRLTNIRRSEPDRSLFEVPSDYRVIDRTAPGRTTKVPELPVSPATAPTPKRRPEAPKPAVTAPATTPAIPPVPLVNL